MNKRPVEKKPVKISFNEFSEEQDYFCYWDANISSDDEMLFNGKSEVLWSRSGDLFQYSDSPQEFSDLTGRTLSSCSWHNDEFDMKSTNKVNASLKAIDDALYDKINSPFISEIVFQECTDWAEKFPYLHIKGTQILPLYEDEPNLQSLNAVGVKDFESSYSGLQLEGKKVPLHLSSKSKEMYVDCLSSNRVPNCITQNSDDEVEEEYFALHKSEAADTLHIVTAENAKPVSSTKSLEEKIIDKLVSEMWPDVLNILDKLDDKNNISNHLQLPPIEVTSEQKRAFNLQRPRTEGSTFLNTEFPKLENVLTVSPKVLQKRDGENNHIKRPNSEMSVNLHLSSKLLKPVSYQTSSNSMHSKPENLLPKGIITERESENSCIILPSLEEHFQDTSSVLRGFHIEPCKKELPQKNVIYSRNEYESSRENEYFLPPIVDKNFMPSNLKLTKNLFTFYGSPATPNKNKTCGSARYNKTNSRPSTSISKRANNMEVNPKLLVKNIAQTNTKSTVNASRSSCSQNHQNEISIINETIQERSVTLFPIVTPLTPHEDRNHSIKKGLLHSFLGVKKR